MHKEHEEDKIKDTRNVNKEFLNYRKKGKIDQSEISIQANCSLSMYGLFVCPANDSTIFIFSLYENKKNATQRRDYKHLFLIDSHF